MQVWVGYRVFYRRQMCFIVLILLINLLGQPSATWLDYLVSYYHDNSTHDDPGAFLEELDTWLNTLLSKLKGDKWEQDIIEQAVSEVLSHLDQVKKEFLASVSN